MCHAHMQSTHQYQEILECPSSVNELVGITGFTTMQHYVLTLTLDHITH